jgi:hypothetical protein
MAVGIRSWQLATPKFQVDKSLAVRITKTFEAGDWRPLNFSLKLSDRHPRIAGSTG